MKKFKDFINESRIKNLDNIRDIITEYFHDLTDNFNVEMEIYIENDINISIQIKSTDKKNLKKDEYLDQIEIILYL